MKEKVALIITLIWPIIPIFWIIVHGFPNLVKKMRISIYPTILFIFVIVLLILYSFKDFLLLQRIFLNDFFVYIGYFFFFLGLFIHIWTFVLLSLPGIIGIPEVTGDKNFNLITNGPFSVIRHPTYLAHTLIFIGAFLFSGYITLLIITILDFLLVVLIIIPLEEKELIKRMGEQYIEYRKKVRWKIIPLII